MGDAGRHTVVDRLRRLTGEWASEQAIEFADRMFTWGDVGDVADVLDRLLETHAIAPGAPVAIVMRQRPGTVVAELAMLRAGRPAVLITPLQGDVALAAELTEMRPPAVVFDPDDFDRRGVSDAIAESGALAITIDADLRPTAVAMPDEPPTCEVMPDAAVTVLTSGTTGRPKRMSVSWESFVDVGGGTDVTRAPRSGRGAVIVAVPMVTLGGLLAISRLVFGGRPMSLLERFDVQSWAALVKRHRPSIIGAPPPVVRMILDAGITPDHFEGVRAYVTSSAALDSDVMRRFQETYGFPVLTSYGATEFLGSVTGWTDELWQQFGERKLGSVGRAKPGVQLRVIDPDTGDVIDDGSRGVLEVDPALRADGMPPGWIRTSDRARIDADGFMWILGRTDDVIIRGGFKVDLADVESAARRHPDVIDACAVGIDDPRLGAVPALIAVAAGNGAHPPAPAQLIEWLRDQLPPYAVPVMVRMVDAIPTTSTLKHDRAAVRAMVIDERVGPDQGGAA